MFGWNRKQNKTSQKLTRDVLIADLEIALNDEIWTTAMADDTLLKKLNVEKSVVRTLIDSDEEVESCKDDLRTAMMSSSWRLYGEGTQDDQIDRLYVAVRKNLETFIELVLTAKLNGYAVGRYVYSVDSDGFINLDRVADRRDDLDQYAVQRDGGLVFVGNGEEVLLNTKVLYILLVNRPSSKRPAGQMEMVRLFPAVSIRRNGFRYANQFLKRYAQPYMVGKINSEARSFINKLYSFTVGGAITVNTDEDVNMLLNNADGEAFEKLERLANARIQKLMLGRVKTSDLKTSSRAAQETEENTREERISAYLNLLGLAVQHAVDALVEVNRLYGQPIQVKGKLWFEFEDEKSIDLDRAQRDKLYAESGQIRFTREYFENILGFEPEHFELVENANDVSDTPAQLDKTSAKLSLTHDLPQHQTAEQKLMQPRLNVILEALAMSENYAEFNEKLNQIAPNADPKLIDQLVSGQVREWVTGWEQKP